MQHGQQYAGQAQRGRKKHVKACVICSWSKEDGRQPRIILGIEVQGRIVGGIAQPQLARADI
jgi:hypothetical protein